MKAERKRRTNHTCTRSGTTIVFTKTGVMERLTAISTESFCAFKGWIAAQPGVPEEKRKFCQNLSTLPAKLDDGLELSP